MNLRFLQGLSFIILFLCFITFTLYAQTEVKLDLLSPNGGEYWTVGSAPRITWKSTNILVIKIEISYDAGITWEIISPAAIAGNGSYSSWLISANLESDNCLIKISKYDDPNVYDISDSAFRIAADTTVHKLVVLGSSTAAGIGPSSSDSGWVRRYRNYLYEKNTTFNVINLAVGGYTTYDIMPSGFIPPANRPTPKTSNNISKAVSYNPNAIIINLPSNDANMGYSVIEQLSNYDAILTVAKANNIPVWVTTTQPRNFSAAQIQMQIEMRDSTFSRFGEKAIDFWTEIADSAGRINVEYNSGDGIHLNDKGHAILFARVVEANIFDPMVVSVEAEKFVLYEFNLMQNYPNPFNPTTNIEFQLPKNAKVTLKIYDVLGRETVTLLNEEKSAGNHKVKFDAGKFASGLYVYTLRADDFFTSKKMLLLK